MVQGRERRDGKDASEDAGKRRSVQGRGEEGGEGRRAGQSCVIEFTFVREGWNRMNIQFLNLPREHTRSIWRRASRSTVRFRSSAGSQLESSVCVHVASHFIPPSAPFLWFDNVFLARQTASIRFQPAQTLVFKHCGLISPGRARRARVLLIKRRLPRT